MDVISNIDHYLENENYSGIILDEEVKYLIKRMLSMDPEKRISPREII
jgi:dual specificity tyrosine-phosphorylation-regulated kinase 2/3/4